MIRPLGGHKVARWVKGLADKSDNLILITKISMVERGNQLLSAIPLISPHPKYRTQITPHKGLHGETVCQVGLGSRESLAVSSD